jgi:L-histidine N-alpha-methyltransferase
MLEGTVPVEAFRHVARWNDPEGRIEMHLEATRDVVFKVAGIGFGMRADESVLTENSVKYGSRDASPLLRSGGRTPIRSWVDDENLLAVILAAATQRRLAP